MFKRFTLLFQKNKPIQDLVHDTQVSLPFGINWKLTRQASSNIVLESYGNDKKLQVRANCSPYKPIFTLVIDDKDTIDFDHWPSHWNGFR
jgi:hypothetical protein